MVIESRAKRLSSRGNSYAAFPSFIIKKNENQNDKEKRRRGKRNRRGIQESKDQTATSLAAATSERTR